tara:strand:- start:164 stop:412 length:249 start_codon:yes stop_codon:yes gene_type:complete
VEELTKKQKEELENLMREVSEEAKKVRLDYKENPSTMSGSVTQVHENSPYIATREERLKTVNDLTNMYPHLYKKGLDKKKKD